MYGYTPPSPPPPVFTLDMVYAWLNSWWSFTSAQFHGLHSLGFADLLNIHIAAVLLPVVIGCWVFAFWRYWRVRSYYGKRQLVDLNSAKIGMGGEGFRFAIRLLIPAAILVALLNPYLPGVPHWVPASATMRFASRTTVAWVQSTCPSRRLTPPAASKARSLKSRATSSFTRLAAAWTWCAMSFATFLMVRCKERRWR